MANVPAVSVVIPTYNIEKYIGECLDSVLRQTLKNYEIIVVDNCSTDSTPAIVESYAEKFGERLIFIRREKNYGGAAFSRNVGINLACGEYIQVVDGDDFLSETALEEFYTLAKNYDADVVYTTARYRFDTEKAWFDKSKIFVDKPTLVNNASEKPLQDFVSKRFNYFWAPWTKFVRRKFLVENEITFPEIRAAEDFIWTLELLCCAKRFLYVSNPVYYWRNDPKSVTHRERPAVDQINFWETIITKGIKTLYKLGDKYDVLKKNPKLLHSAMSLLFEDSFGRCFNARLQVSSEDIYETLLDNSAEREKFYSASIVPYLYSRLDFMYKQLLISQQQINQVVAQVQKESEQNRRRYIKLASQVQARIAELEAQLKTK